MEKKVLRYMLPILLIVFFTIADFFLLRLIYLSPKLPSTAHNETLFTHSVLDEKNPGTLILKGSPGDKADIMLLEGTLYKQVTLRSKKEIVKIR